MISHHDVQLALRARLVAITVATTGVITLSATTTGYARTTGSFLADGLAIGMELTPTGFASNPVDLIIGITALTVTTTNPRAVEAAAAGRSLVVALPRARAWENVGFSATPGLPFVDEQYVRGSATLDTIGPTGRITGEPMYLPRINVPAGAGVGAANRYADAIVNAFPPGDKIALASGDVIEVRGDHAPYAGQLLQGEPGFAGLLCTVPLRVRTLNSR